MLQFETLDYFQQKYVPIFPENFNWVFIRECIFKSMVFILKSYYNK